MIRSTKINKVCVKPVITNQEYEDPKRILGYDMFANLYSNIALISKKRSGKTSVIYNILKACANKTSRVIVFCPTVHLDKTYEAIFDMLDKKGIDYEKFSSIKDEDDKKVDILNELLKEMEQAAEPTSSDHDRSTDEPEKKLMLIMPPTEEEKKVAESKRIRKPKKLAPEIIFIFDDCSTMLRSNSVSSLLKKNRHHKAKVILSSQNLTDLDVPARKNLDYFLCFRSLNDSQLERIHSDTDLCNTFETFKALYEHATADPFNFLYVDIRRDEYRKNFNLQIDV